MGPPAPDQPTDARARLLSHFSTAQGTIEHGQKWDDLYQQGFIPWDKGLPNPALVDLLSHRKDLLPRRPADGRRPKALVPGCGRGYDVLLFSAFGYDAYGLEQSPYALDEARKLESAMAGKGPYETREGEQAGKITWLAGDFFADEFPEGVDQGKFDLIYDYTFLCALPPFLRPAWSQRHNELLAPEGRLVCIEFPTYKPANSGGPPWALPTSVYMAHLPRPGRKLDYDADSGDLIEDNLKDPSENGLKRIAHFLPEKTHGIGYDAEGKITDWVGIWAHPK